MEDIQERVFELKSQFKNIEEVQSYIDDIVLKREIVERNIPGLWLDLKVPEYNLDNCFTNNGNPIGDYRVNPYTKKFVKNAMKNVKKKGKVLVFPVANGNVYIKTNPSFLLVMDLDVLSNEKSITKIINGNSVSFCLSKYKYSLDKGDIMSKEIVASYKKELENGYSEIEDRLEFYDNQLMLLYMVKKQLEYENIDYPRRKNIKRAF